MALLPIPASSYTEFAAAPEIRPRGRYVVSASWSGQVAGCEIRVARRYFRLVNWLIPLRLRGCSLGPPEARIVAAILDHKVGECLACRVVGNLFWRLQGGPGRRRDPRPAAPVRQM